MMRILLVATLLALSALPAQAQTATPDSENGRFTFNQVPDGLLRLDTRTGQVSLCSKRSGRLGVSGRAGRARPRSRARSRGCRTRTPTLKKEMIARGVPLPGGVSAEPPAVRAADRAEAAERRRHRPGDDLHGEDLAPAHRHGPERAEGHREEGVMRPRSRAPVHPAERPDLSTFHDGSLVSGSPDRTRSVATATLTVETRGRGFFRHHRRRRPLRRASARRRTACCCSICATRRHRW